MQIKSALVHSDTLVRRCRKTMCRYIAGIKRSAEKTCAEVIIFFDYFVMRNEDKATMESPVVGSFIRRPARQCSVWYLVNTLQIPKSSI